MFVKTATILFGREKIIFKIAAEDLYFEFWWDVKLDEVISNFCKTVLNVNISWEISTALQVAQRTRMSPLETPTCAAVLT